ncbi:hypothetical protein [Hymenobacter psoromatis]|uniref:hypothetical protein n=1 Tax=Hymenobacter psoromatis TaxID=1484116 RepID=UPI001CBC4337|nr:hypothetical protein [Hymenobacter psoromatis]
MTLLWQCGPAPVELRQWRGTVAECCACHASHTRNATVRCPSLPSPVASQVFLLSSKELLSL